MKAFLFNKPGKNRGARWCLTVTALIDGGETTFNRQPIASKNEIVFNSRRLQSAAE